MVFFIRQVPTRYMRYLFISRTEQTIYANITLEYVPIDIHKIQI